MTVSTSVSIDEIMEDHVYLGNLAAALSLEWRNKSGITHILSVCPEYPSTPEDANHLNIPVQDSEYEDLLIHIPKACSFIQQALDGGGRLLVHCVMGVSRSATVMCAYLMWSRKITTVQAVAFIKKRRPQIHPNYGFIKQLQAFEACGYDPSPSNPAYRAWKRRRIQEVTHFLNALSDTTSIIPDKLCMSNEFPGDPGEAEALLQDMRITHIISLSPAQLQLPSSVVHSVTHRHINVPSYEPDALLLALPQICQSLSEAIGNGGHVLVHCRIESRACIVISAYLMYSQNLCAAEAFALIEAALPLFDPSAAFHEQLAHFESCKHKPSSFHPSSSTSASSFATTAAVLNATANKFLSGTKHDVSAFKKTLENIQQSVMT